MLFVIVRQLAAYSPEARAIATGSAFSPALCSAQNSERGDSCLWPGCRAIGTWEHICWTCRPSEVEIPAQCQPGQYLTSRFGWPLFGANVDIQHVHAWITFVQMFGIKDMAISCLFLVLGHFGWLVVGCRSYPFTCRVTRVHLVGLPSHSSFGVFGILAPWWLEPFVFLGGWGSTQKSPHRHPRSTVGYGDLAPTTPVSRTFTLFFIIYGIVVPRLCWSCHEQLVSGVVQLLERWSQSAHFRWRKKLYIIDLSWFIIIFPICLMVW